jgi:hypothetical protein
MVLWFADTSDPSGHYHQGAKRMLISFAYILKQADCANWMRERPADAEVFLDSGAFGVSTGRARIDLAGYVAYIKHISRAERDLFTDAPLVAGARGATQYASLDVIGDWRASRKNYDAMLAHGLTPIPTFHKGSPWEELDRLAGSSPGLLALGGMAARNQSQTLVALRPYLDKAWSILQRHWPVKVHAFGVVGQDILERYPFYSADSATHVLSASMGRVKEFVKGRLIGNRPWKEYALEKMDMVVMDRVGQARSGRRLRNIEAMLKMERHVTSLWRYRGVSWDEAGSYTGTV